MKRTLLLLFFYICNAIAYRPVILLHGILTGSQSMELIKNCIEEKHPGTLVYNIDKFEGWSSLENMWYQVQQVSQIVLNITRNHTQGVNFLGYSQGALLGRTILQANPNHTIHRYISLSGPQGGQYGTQFLHLYFPGLALETAFELFYSRVGQHTSVGNYWNDPYHKKLFYDYSQYLPYVNNEVKSNKSEEFKAALLKLDKLVLIGGPQDNVITPWQSSHFGYYNENGTVVDFKDTITYQQDTIGLKTLYEKKKLILVTVPGIDHFMWHTNVTICDNYILPYLD